MTIIKVSKDGKVLEKKKAEDAMVMLEPEIHEPAVRTLHISAVTSARSRRIVNIFLLIIALLVLAAGIIGGVYLYKYIQNRHKLVRIGVPYNDPEAQKQGTTEGQKWVGYLYEDIEIQPTQSLERIEVPQFDECRQSVIMHDFHMNYTVIVDPEDRECFIMDLDRTRMQPPKSFAELVQKYASGYYMPRVDVVRRDYRVVTPALKDLSFAGAAIAMECSHFDSYKLEKKDPVPKIEFYFRFMKTYGYSNLQHVIKDNIYK